MKKILLILTLLIFPLQCMAVNISEYTDKPYIGIPYEEGLKQQSPLILVFANSNDIFSVIKMAPIGEMVYNEYKGKYNFCILNTKVEENENLYNDFGIDETLPVMLVINTKSKTYYKINKKFYSKKQLKPVLDELYEKLKQ